MKSKILVICTVCLYNKKTNEVETDPKGTRYVFIDGCEKCGEDGVEPIQYLDKNLNLLVESI